ncbi:MAG: SH3 domain-containing protein [Clostridia bacterium]|nr:SH3 domain-containing protein [Clostridia bacterium]
MKHTRLNRAFSLLITLAFLLAFIPAPAAFAASDTFITGCQASSVPVYYAMDTTSKTYTTLDIGARVNVRDKYNNTWWRVNVENNLYSTEGTFSVGYVRSDSGFLPSNIPTDTFIGESTTTTPCLLYSCASVNKGNLTQLTTGTKLRVVQQIGDFYLVFVAPQFYGYVRTQDCTAFSVTAPTVTAAPTTATGNNASSAAVGFDDLTVASKGKLAVNAMLYGINDIKSNPIAQTATGGDAQVYYRVANDFYLISTGQNYGFYAYVPTQSITVYDMAAVPHIAGTVNAISSISNGQTIVAAGAAAASKTATIANCSSWVSMRSEASSKSKRLYKLNKGKSVTVLGTEGSYTKIKYDGKTGYVLSTYVK